MSRLSSNSKINSSVVSLIFTFVIAFVGLAMVAIGETEISGTICLLFVVIMCYSALLTRIKLSTRFTTIFCDARFYVFTSFLLYSVIPPVYSLLTLKQNGGVRVRSAYNANVYSTEELFMTLIMSALFFSGLLFGFYLRDRASKPKLSFDTFYPNMDYNPKRKFYGWLCICVVSTVFFYIPFIRGGFKIIEDGGTIIDVDRTIATGVLGNFQDVFFSADLMTASTVALVYYLYKLNISSRSKRIVLILTIFLQVFGAFLTTRRARAFSIILCVFAIYIYWYERRNNKLPRTQVVIVTVSVLFLYLLEVIMGQRQIDGGLSSYLRLFDGITAYDSLLLATREQTSISMLNNIIYGIFRPIPIIGKYIIDFLGMPTDAAPLYHWMAARYSMYKVGGGLAYTPQLEAYLCLNYFGCFIFGVIYGIIFGKQREGLLNLFIIAMSFSIARGTIQVLLKLLWPFGIIGFYFYDQFLFNSSNSFERSLKQRNQ